MSNKKAFLAFLSALAMSIGSSQAQDCASCGDNVQFGYPVVASQGGMASRHQARKERHEAWQEESAKITARNDAWPRPFACHDKQAYFAVWTPMIDRGYAMECALCADHFNPDTNELNGQGQAKVAAIMQNIPSDRRAVYVPRHNNETVSQTRLDSVNHIVKTFYGHSNPNTMIALSDLQAPMISGVQADAISKGYLEGIPAPVIPVVSGGAGVSSSTNQ